MNTQDLIKKLEAGEVVDQSTLIKALENSQKASNSDRVAKYGKNHECKTYLAPATLHKDLSKQLQAQGYKSQKDFSYHMAETFEAMFASLDNVASLEPAHIVQALEQFEELEPVEESDSGE